MLMAITAHADEDGLTGDIALNGSKSTGNTETTDAGLALQLGWATGDWTQDLRASAEFGRQADTTNKKRYRVGYSLAREFDNDFYAYGNADYFQTDFDAYKYGAFVGGGLGYHVLKGTTNWDLEAGPGYRRQKTREPIDVGPASVIQEGLAVRAHSDFQWEINERVSAYNLTEIIYSSDDTYIWNDVGLTADLFGGLAARVSFRVDHHTDVPLGSEKTDTVTRVGVVYKID